MKDTYFSKCILCKVSACFSLVKILDICHCLRRQAIEAYRTISTGKLHVLLRFHTQPINVVVFHGSQRDLVLRGASRLDAFSGYPVHT